MSMRYRIGEFSKLGKVSVKTLRYYDEEGILRPGYVDGFNRYRYYLPEQLTTLCTILRYRRAGLSIEEIKTLLSGADPADTARAQSGDRIGEGFRGEKDGPSGPHDRRRRPHGL